MSTSISRRVAAEALDKVVHRPRLKRNDPAISAGRGLSSCCDANIAKKRTLASPFSSSDCRLLLREIQDDVDPAVFLPAFGARVVGEAAGLAEARGGQTLALDAHVRHGSDHALGALLGELHRLRRGALLVAGVSLDRGGDARVG